MSTPLFVQRRGQVSSVALAALFLLCLLCQRQVSAFLPSTTSRPPQSRLQHVYAISNNDESPIPFVIERLPDNTIQQGVFREIAQVCIEAFFNDGGNAVPPWTQFQLSSLRSLQQADLKFRRRRDPQSNMMFVARRVHPAMETSARTTPLILDLKQVYNLVPKRNQEYVRGEILGFVEVTKKPYGLGQENGIKSQVRRKRSELEKRPVLTNLSVQYQARKSGVGSRLVEICESKVMNEWKMYEIILEVEEDNERAQKFYQKRGYKVIFEDPTSRRYDVSGLWLRQKRCKRKIMRKALNGFPTPTTSKSTDNNVFASKILQRLRESVLPTARI